MKAAQFVANVGHLHLFFMYVAKHLRVDKSTKRKGAT